MVIYFMNKKYLLCFAACTMFMLSTTSCILFDLPDVSEIKLSSCLKTCNTQAKKCLDSAEQKLLSCPTDAGSSGTKCQLLASSDSKACLTVCLDCISVCSEDVEKILKSE